MTAAEARSATGIGVRAQVRAATGAAERTIADLLDGYEAPRSPVAQRIRAALAAEGVDLASIPKRSADELAAWARDRQRCARCRRLEARIAELEALLVAATARARPLGVVPAGGAEGERAATG